ncbi:DNA-binding response regulator, OmpR family, contains REC and winged-helix (wHTH) domain [Pustulibacterium marinum]|uniref:DNA-binding response regulator, OmpR family, contains REC and winged-helix (WHTH) domain n=1 Tax=Pustulibacterium marinum TaxID=1224947 RepID=A0A1I7EYZ6_9FLAO|nr:response regulator transcription factor [Pustulibacterium marinum]SFU29119.1 DNA-binding response regulator, OmpR family, contains REC and winged-helix (wHTH) domain [Pustulibacterium marinum]
MAKYKILLVEDDATIGYLLTEYLKMKNFEVLWTKNGAEGLDAVKQHTFHLCITDVMMPVMDGFTFAEELKKINTTLPFIFLTARSMKIDALKGFSLGAVDYLRKPIDEEELLVRIETILARLQPVSTSEKKDSTFTIGDYLLNTDNQELYCKNELLYKLTTRESELLSMLIENEGNLCSHKVILENIWGKNDYFNRKSLNVFITRLRKYLKEDDRILIENVHNQGFILRFKA